MRFKQFLSEQEMTSVRVLIEKNCKPFLDKANGRGFLYRGVKDLSRTPPYSTFDAEGNEIEYGIKMVRKDRKPLDFNKFRSKIMDDWFYEKFGVRARSHCMFATGEKTPTDDIKFYGTPCVVFPIGEFKYVWSPEVEDLYGSMNLGAANDGKAYTEAELEEKIQMWLSQHNYQTDGLDNAVQMQHEVMIDCESYYAFPIEYTEAVKLSLGF